MEIVIMTIIGVILAMSIIGLAIFCFNLAAECFDHRDKSECFFFLFIGLSCLSIIIAAIASTFL